MRLFSTKEAADYLGVTERTIKWYVHEAGYLKGQKVGHSLVFTQEELDALNASGIRRKKYRRKQDKVE
ncbi:MAG: helix-turn-helix domain-containing protein [Anaerolineae bacterium]|nr:helix-turn-helix domain-containing protein [Anaerolineae bacterium]